jgi:hypothetical protein
MRARLWDYSPDRSAPVAQLDRAPDYESGGQEFESLRARHGYLTHRHHRNNLIINHFEACRWDQTMWAMSGVSKNRHSVYYA